MCEDDIFDIPYVKLQFFLEMQEDTILPPDKTSALRGGLGEMLLRQNCVRDRDCEHCPFQADCVVWDTFYSRADQKPDFVTGKESVGYLIVCNDHSTQFPAGSLLMFQLTLFGRSLVFFHIFLQAFAYLGICGLGKYQARFRIREVRNTQRRPLILDQMVDMGEYQIHSLRSYVYRRKRKLSRGEGAYILTFRSPLSMKYHGEYLERFSGEALVLGAMRRVSMLDAYVGRSAEQTEITVFPEIRTQYVRSDEIRRYSSTQDAKIYLMGIGGKVVFETMPEDCLEYLLAGEVTQIGKNTSFGFGQYGISREG